MGPSHHSSLSGTTKLRRKWTYIAYSSSDTASKDKNLFGRVEEERDADGLRHFEYDWRGLVLKAYHKFWDVTDGSGRDWDNDSSDMWNTSLDWDPAVPSTSRGSISSWLVLDNLTDTTTVTVTTAYDAAGRPTEVSYPEGMKLRSTWSAAGLLARIEVDRGAGGGYADAMKEAAYNARGQVVSFKTGNDAKTTREYDSALERLTRIFTRRDVGGTITDFQDLLYAYDPVGNPIRITDDLAVSTYKANQIIPNARTFRYDPRYRLIRATGKKHRTIVDKTSNVLVTSPDPKDYEPYTFRYSYDAVGNFTTNQEYKSGTNNLNYKSGRIDLFNGDATEAGSYTDPTLGNFTYDANGNTTKTPRLSALKYTMDNQCRWVDLGGGGQVRYLRHIDQRVVRFVNKGGGTRALGVYLGPWEYHQRQGALAYTKAVLRAVGHGTHTQVERVVGGSDPDSLNTCYHHGDHLASAQVLTKEDGTLLSQEEYFPHGRPSDRRDARNRYRYIGVERDEDTLLSMTGPRQFDPISARFLQADPAPAETQWFTNPFAYARAQPVKRTDRSGYQDEPASAPPVEREAGVDIDADAPLDIDIDVDIGPDFSDTSGQVMSADDLVKDLRQGRGPVKFAGTWDASDREAAIAEYQKLAQSEKFRGMVSEMQESGSSTYLYHGTSPVSSRSSTTPAGKYTDSPTEYGATGTPRSADIWLNDPGDLLEEMVHAHDYNTGELDPNTTEYALNTSTGDVVRSIRNDEWQALGVGPWKDRPYSINAIRAELDPNYAFRNTYGQHQYIGR